MSKTDSVREEMAAEIFRQVWGEQKGSWARIPRSARRNYLQKADHLLHIIRGHTSPCRIMKARLLGQDVTPASKKKLRLCDVALTKAFESLPEEVKKSGKSKSR